MIRKIRQSLFAKVFIITVFLLLCVSFVVYGALAILMPQTYSNNLNDVLDKNTQNFITELEQVREKNSNGLFEQFLQNDGVSYVELYTDDGQQIVLPFDTQGQSNSGYASEMAGSSSENVATSSSSYYFSFADTNARYMLVVYGSATQIAELQQSFLRVLPILFCIILAVSLIVSWIYSWMITKPVLKISLISKKMSDLKLDWRLDEQRSDELGVLEKSLNNLSQKLALTLSDLQSANQQLEKDIELGKELEQARLNFFSAASHELKTPITVIKGQLEGMILGIGAYKDRDKYLTRSLEIANSLESMVQEILTISRLETSGTDFQTECVNCVSVIREYLAQTEDLIVQKELQINLDVPQIANVKGNHPLIEMIFSNLIGNAIKYSSQGATINIMIHDCNHNILFSVENTGTHISENEFSNLFDAFYRVDQSRNKKTGGSGLGLYIVQKALEQHKSTCHVCNTTYGVQFYFTL